MPAHAWRAEPASCCDMGFFTYSAATFAQGKAKRIGEVCGSEVCVGAPVNVVRASLRRGLFFGALAASKGIFFPGVGFYNGVAAGAAARFP